MVQARKRQSLSQSCPSEHVEQVTFVNWFRLKFPRVLIFAIPNGGFRDHNTAKKLKAEGVISGIPDLFIPAWKFWIEMKRQKGGTLSKDQKEKITYLQNVGYTVHVAKGYQHAKEIINEHTL